MQRIESDVNHPVLPPGALPCIWMTAGVVTYRLCDRDLGCDGCPLDAALRGLPAHVGAAPAGTWSFPDDRRYTVGHAWARREGPERVVGIDSFAAALLRPAGVREIICAEGDLGAGDVAFEIHIEPGAVAMSLPLAGRAAAGNPRLTADPTTLVRDPYGEGWLLRVVVSDESRDDAGWARLLQAEEARKQARMDLRHLGRRVALQLLAESAPLGALLADGGEAVLDFRQLLGPKRYADTIRAILG